MRLNTLTHLPAQLSPRSRGSRWILGLSGVVLLAIGASILLAPVAYQANMGVELPHEPTLLSDMRAMGGGLMGIGLLILVGALWRPLSAFAAIAGAVLYGSYGLARVLSMLVDGLPSDTLVGSAALELLIGSISTAIVLWGMER